MRNYALVILSILAMFASACRDNSKDAGPDLTTSLTGQLSATYLITNLTTGQSVTGPNSTIKLDRKNNNTLIIGVTINDSTIQVNDRFEATVMTESLESDGLLLPNLRSRYKLTVANLNNRGSGVSTINLYADGKIRGGISYTNAIGQIVSLAFVR